MYLGIVRGLSYDHSTDDGKVHDLFKSFKRLNPPIGNQTLKGTLSFLT